MKKILITKFKSEFFSHSQVIFDEILYIINCLDKSFINKILKYDQLIISSKNGAIAFLENLKFCSHTNIVAIIKNKKILIVGESTHKILQKNEFKNLSSPHSAIQFLIEKEKLNNTLYLSGYDIAFENYQSLGVQRIILYKAIQKALKTETQKKILNQEISHIVIYSKRSVKIFLKNLPMNYDFSKVKFFCMSESIANYIKSLNSTANTFYLQNPTEREMNKMIQRELKDRNILS